MRTAGPRAVGIMALALLLALPGTGSAQREASYTVAGIDYYYATGSYGTGHFAFGADPATQVVQEYEGCGWAKLRPDANRGRIQALGTWGDIPFTVDASQFPDANATPDAMAPDALVPAAAATVGMPWTSTMMATTTNATIRLGGGPINDPVTGEPQFAATWFVTPRGFRDDADGHVVPAGADEWEMHLKVGSRPGVERQGPATWSHSEPSDGIPMLPDESYSLLMAVPNDRLFGKATMTVEASSNAPAGSNDLTFTAYAPDGVLLGEVQLAPAFGAAASQALEFDLGKVGDYYVEAHGKVSLASYSIEVVQEPPESFVLDLWWDEVRPGYEGLQEKEACSQTVNGALVASFVPPRPPPVEFDWPTTLFTVGAGLTLLAVVVSLGIAARNAAIARRAVKG